MSGSRTQVKWSTRGRLFRTLTFWLRPAFVLRTVTRFQRIAGFDRAVALASSALTGVVPLAVIAGTVLAGLGREDLGERIVDRYELTGAGAEAVHAIFSPAGGPSAGIGVIGALLLIVALLSFSRSVQRLYEQTWELAPLSVRNTLNGLRWSGVFLAYLAATGWIHGVAGHGRLELAASILIAPLTAGLLVWGGRALSAKRLQRRDLAPFAVIAAVLLAAYSVGAAVYVPRMFESYAARYGAIGAVLALISTLVCVMVVVVGSAALGREVGDELHRIRRGERPPDDEVRREWNALVAETRSQFAMARVRVDRLRARARRRRP